MTDSGKPGWVPTPIEDWSKGTLMFWSEYVDAGLKPPSPADHELPALAKGAAEKISDGSGH